MKEWTVLQKGFLQRGLKELNPTVQNVEPTEKGEATSLIEIGEWAQKNLDFSHDELKGEFANWIRSNLDYQTPGEDLRIELRKESGRPDIQSYLL